MTKKVYLRFPVVRRSPQAINPDCSSAYCCATASDGIEETEESTDPETEDQDDNPDFLRQENDTKGKHWKTLLAQLPTPTEAGLAKLSKIVEEYDAGTYHDGFISSVSEVYSLADCVTGANNGQLEDKVLTGEKIHKNSHLKHYQTMTLLEMAKRLRYEEFNYPFSSFEDLYHKVECTAGRNPDGIGYTPIDRFGIVGMYDTALRIGYHISPCGNHDNHDNPDRVMPQRYVYVHQGSREGFMHLVRRGLVDKNYLPELPGFIKVDVRCFIGALKDMEAYKIENLLCCMKKHLSKI